MKTQPASECMGVAEFDAGPVSETRCGRPGTRHVRHSLDRIDGLPTAGPRAALAPRARPVSAQVPQTGCSSLAETGRPKASLRLGSL
jgi:hypothetical protein